MGKLPKLETKGHNVNLMVNTFLSYWEVPSSSVGLKGYVERFPRFTKSSG
jgi:hypothetical protein